MYPYIFVFSVSKKWINKLDYVYTAGFTHNRTHSCDFKKKRTRKNDFLLVTYKKTIMVFILSVFMSDSFLRTKILLFH